MKAGPPKAPAPELPDKSAAVLAGAGRAMGWAFASQLGRHGTAFVTTMVLARYLLPADFGLVGMATLFTGLVTIVNDVGVSGALVQRRDISDAHLSSMFWLNQVVGVALCALTLAAAPLLASFFGSPALVPVVRVLSLGFIAGALGVVQQLRLTRALNFRKLGILETVAALSAGAAAIVAAWQGAGVWSLVVQMLVAPVLTTLGLWITSGWRPKLCFDRKALGELVPYGLNMAGFNVVGYFARNLDYLIVGRLLGAVPLGYYTLAYRIMVYPLQSVSQTVARVCFPAFSRASGDTQALAAGFLRMVKGVSLVTFPMVCGIFAIAPDFIQLCYGSAWAPTAQLLRILCVAGLVQSVGTTVGSVYQALGRPNLQLRMALGNTALTCVALLIGVQWGLLGVATAYSVYAVCWVHFSMFVVTRLLHTSYWELYRRLSPSFVASLLMLIGVMWSQSLLPRASVIGLVVAVVVGALVQIGALLSMGQLRWAGKRPVLSL